MTENEIDKAIRRQYYIDNREKILEYQKIYRIKNGSKIKERSINRKKANPDKVNEYHREYREKNAEKIRERNRLHMRKVRMQKSTA